MRVFQQRNTISKSTIRRLFGQTHMSMIPRPYFRHHIVLGVMLLALTLAWSTPGIAREPGVDQALESYATDDFFQCNEPDGCPDAPVDTMPEPVEPPLRETTSSRMSSPAEARFPDDMDLTDNTLVVYNVNASDALEIAQYYANARGIDPARLCPVELPTGQFASAAHLMGARKTIIENCLCEAIHDAVPSDEWPDPCDDTNLDNIARVSPITHLALIKGIPPRLYGTGWPPGASWDSGDDEEPSFDYYLSVSLYDNNDLVDAGSDGNLPASNFVGFYGHDSIDFQIGDSTHGYVRTINPALDKIVAYGRIEAINTERTKELIDRTLAAEANGVSGNIVTESPGPYTFLRDLTSSRSPACNAYYFEPYSAWPYETCRAGTTENGEIPGEASKTVAIPRAINVGAFLGSNPWPNTQMSFDGFYNMLNWHKADYDCTTLCRDFVDPVQEQACRDASTDYFREINTACVGVADGFIGHQYRSYPVQYYGVYPAGWLTISTGAVEKTPPLVLTGDAYHDAQFTDDTYLRFGAVDAVDNPTCTLADGTIESCREKIAIYMTHVISLDDPVVIGDGDTHDYRVKLRYRNKADSGGFAVVVYFDMSEGDDSMLSHGISLDEANQDWRTAEFIVTAKNAGTLTTIKTTILARLGSNLADYLELDGIEVIDMDTGVNLVLPTIGSFSAPSIGNVTNGDYAANVIDRLGGIAWWGSSSHFRTGGHAFGRSDQFAGALYAGRSLGESLAYLGVNAKSGIIYGDPLYRPSGVKIFANDGLTTLNDEENPYRFNVFTDTTSISLNAFHGRQADVQWELALCYMDIDACDAGNSWLTIDSGNSALYGYELPTSLVDFMPEQLDARNFILRLQVWKSADPDYTLTNYAYFQPAPNITVNRVGGFTPDTVITSTPTMVCEENECYGFFSPGTQVTLSASPGDITAFDGWVGGDCDGQTGDCVVTVGEDPIEVTAPFHLTGFDCKYVSDIPDEECDALTALYHNTDGENWTRNTDWLKNLSPCTWSGVTCTSGHVTRLQLRSNGMTGSLPAEMENLSALSTLDLTGNGLTGSIPAELGNLSALMTLNLSGNDLTGSLPAELGNLTALLTLDLSSNELTGSIPAELKNLSALRTLDLSWNGLTGSIPAELGNLSVLRTLDLSSNDLTGSIPAELGNLSALMTLNLSGNDLTGSLPAELGNLSALQQLYLYDNKLMGSIPAQLGNLSELQEMYLYSNQLEGLIPPELGNLVNLKWLLLYNNRLHGAIPSEIGALSALQTLILGGNQLSGEIPASITNLTTTGFLLAYNMLTASDPAVIAFLDQAAPGWDVNQTIPPVDVQASEVACTRATLAWSPILYTGDGGGYVISVSTNPGGPYTEHGTTADKSINTYTVDNLQAETTYYFVIQTHTPPHGLDGSGFPQQNDLFSDYSQEVSATTPACPITAKGDLNGDGATDLTDAIIALQVLSGFNPPQLRADYVSSKVDVNGDDRVGMEELIYILQYEAGLRQTNQ